MELTKNEKHILKYCSRYKLLSIASMLFGIINIPYGFYFSKVKVTTYQESKLNAALIGASIVVVGMGYLMCCFLKIIEKMKRSELIASTDNNE